MISGLPSNSRRVPEVVRRSREEAEAVAVAGESIELVVEGGGAPAARVPLDRVVLRFTTLSNDATRGSFVVERCGASFGRDAAANAIAVPSDLTMEEKDHATIEWSAGVFRLRDEKPRAPGQRVAVRVSVGPSFEWPLDAGAAFSIGNSVFAVTAVDADAATLTLEALTGPLQGRACVVGREGSTLGRASENHVSIADRELSRRHSQICYEETRRRFYLSDLGSTNGTYMQLCGPYAGARALAIGDHILVARTGFAINRFDYGASEECGMRRTMEDKSVIVQDLAVPALAAAGLGPQTFAAVYDGHGGTQASQYLAENLHQNLKAALLRCADDVAAAHAAHAAADDGAADDGGGVLCDEVDAKLRAAIRTAFLFTDEQFLASSEHPQAGSTATTALIIGRRAYCANVGDSRTVLCARGVARALSSDHKPTREDEAARVKAAGGFIVHGRVMGELAVSRAFGDVEFKKPIGEILEPGEAELWSGGGDGGDGASDGGGAAAEPQLNEPLVTAEPEIEVAELGPRGEADRDFLLLACDGLFDVYSNEAAVEKVRAELGANPDPQAAAEALTHAAIHERASRDNVSAVLVML